MGKPYRQIAAGHLARIDAHDVLVDRTQPQQTFCVKLAEGCDGGQQALYLEVTRALFLNLYSALLIVQAHSEEEKEAILSKIREAASKCGQETKVFFP